MSPRADITKEEAQRILLLGGGKTGDQIEDIARAAAADLFLEQFGMLRREMNQRFDQTDSIARASVLRSEDAAQGVRNIAYLVQGGESGKGEIGDLAKSVASMKKLQKARHKVYMKKFSKGLSNQAEFRAILLKIHEWLCDKGDGKHSRYYRIARWLVLSIGAALSAIFGGYSIPYIHPHLMQWLQHQRQ